MSGLNPKTWGGIFGDLPRPARPVGKGQIVGLRLCSLLGDLEGGLVLTSLGRGMTPWLSGQNNAICLAGDRPHAAPARRCRCGLYGGSDLVALSRVLGGLNTHENTVLCGIQAWGRLVVHDWGFRAEYARIVTLSSQLPSRVIRRMDGRIIRMFTEPSMDAATANYLACYYRATLVPLSEMAMATAAFGDFLTAEH